MKMNDSSGLVRARQIAARAFARLDTRKKKCSEPKCRPDGQKLSGLRFADARTAGAVAVYTGLPLDTVEAAERGELVTWRVLEKMAAFYGCSTLELVREPRFTWGQRERRKQERMMRQSEDGEPVPRDCFGQPMSESRAANLFEAKAEEEAFPRFVAELRGQRKRHGISQEELAERASVDRRTIIRLEDPQPPNKVRKGTLKKIEKGLEEAIEAAREAERRELAEFRESLVQKYADEYGLHGSVSNLKEAANSAEQRAAETYKPGKHGPFPSYASKKIEKAVRKEAECLAASKLEAPEEQKPISWELYTEHREKVDKIAYKLAWKYARNYELVEQLEDLKAAGRRGLVRALETYKADKGTKFPT